MARATLAMVALLLLLGSLIYLTATASAATTTAADNVTDYVRSATDPSHGASSSSTTTTLDPSKDTMRRMALLTSIEAAVSELGAQRSRSSRSAGGSSSSNSGEGVRNSGSSGPQMLYGFSPPAPSPQLLLHRAADALSQLVSEPTSGVTAGTKTHPKGSQARFIPQLAWGAQQYELSHGAAAAVITACLDAISAAEEPATDSAAAGSGSVPYGQPDEMPTAQRAYKAGLGGAATQQPVLAAIQAGLTELLALAPARSSSFPIVRRSVMVLLLLAYRGMPAPSSGNAGASAMPSAAGGSGSGQQQQQETHVLYSAWHSILHDLYRLHVRGVTARGMIEHVHISKAAGSSLCQLAKRNRCSTEIFRANNGRGNCLIVRLDDVPRWISKEAHIGLGFPPEPLRPYVRFGQLRSPAVGCAARRELMMNHSWNFYGNEYTTIPELDQDGSSGGGSGSVSSGSRGRGGGSSSGSGIAVVGGYLAGGSSSTSSSPFRGGLCKEFVTLMVFRNPYERLVSHANYIIEQYVGLYRSLEPGGKRGIVRRFQQMTAEQWRELAPSALDNYYARSLLGEAAFNAPVGTLGDAELAAAQAVLTSVDVLLDTGLPLADDLNMRYGLGWRHGLVDAHAKVSKGHVLGQGSAAAETGRTAGHGAGGGGGGGGGTAGVGARGGAARGGLTGMGGALQGRLQRQRVTSTGAANNSIMGTSAEAAPFAQIRAATTAASRSSSSANAVAAARTNSAGAGSRFAAAGAAAGSGGRGLMNTFSALPNRRDDLHPEVAAVDRPFMDATSPSLVGDALHGTVMPDGPEGTALAEARSRSERVLLSQKASLAGEEGSEGIRADTTTAAATNSAAATAAIADAATDSAAAAAAATTDAGSGGSASSRVWPALIELITAANDGVDGGGGGAGKGSGTSAGAVAGTEAGSSGQERAGAGVGAGAGGGGGNLLDGHLYLLSRTFALLDAALFGYVQAAGIDDEMRQEGIGVGGRGSGGGGGGPRCGHVGRNYLV